MIRRVLRGLFVTLLMLLLLVVGAVAFVQTEWGKRTLADQLSSLLSTPESGIVISGVEGWLPIDMSVRLLQLSDSQGPWLEARDIALDWSPSALLSGRVQIDLARVRHLHVIRSPEGSETPEEPPSDEPFRLPELPSSLPPVTLEKLEIEKIQLDAPVLGEAAEFEMGGSLTASDDGRTADLALNLKRTDQPSAFLDLTSTIGLDPLTLAIDLDAGESGQLLEQLSGRPDAGDLEIKLAGEGPLENWSGALNAKTDGLGTADAKLTLALVDQPKLGLDASIRPAENVLPADIRALIGDSLNVGLAVTQTRAQAITLDRLTLGADKLGLEGAGSVDFEKGDLLLNAALNAPDLAALSTIAGMPLAGQAGVTLDLGGTIEEPDGAIDLRLSALDVDGITVDSLTTTVDLKPLAPLSSDHAGFHVQATGSAEGLTIPDVVLPDETITWNATLDAPLDGALAIQQAEIATAGATLTTKGDIDPQTLVSALDLQLAAPALARLAGPYGQPIEGVGAVDAAIETTEGAKSISVDLKAALSELSNLPEGGGDLLGGRLDLKAALNLEDMRRLTVSSLILDGAEANLNGKANLDLESRDLAADIEASLPRLSALADLIDRPIEGALDLTAKVGGTLDAPIADLSLTSDRFTIDGEAIQMLALKVQGKELAAAPEGDLNLDLTARGLPLSLAVDYKLEGEKLALSAIKLDGPSTAINGDLAIDLDRTLFDGALKGRLGDLAAFSPLLDMPLAGSVDLDAKLRSENAKQNADLRLDGKSIEGDFGAIDSIGLTAALKDLLGEMTLAATTRLRGFKQGETSLSSLDLQTRGNLDRLSIDLDLEGEAIQPLAIDATATLALAGPITVDIDRLEGAFAGEPLRLAAPLHVEQGETTLEVANLDLRLGAAGLKGGVALGEREISGQIDLTGVPLAWLQRFEGPVLTGDAAASVNLSGAVDQPSIQAVLDIKGMQADGVSSTDLPPVDVNLNARLDQGRLSTQLRAIGLTEQPITANAAHPLGLTLRPFAVAMPEDGALSGEVDMDVQLARVADLLVLDEQILRGALSAHIDLSGTLQAPELVGPITLKNGYYENSLSGTVFSDLTMQATATRERLTIDQLAGDVGKSGRVEAKGYVDIDPAANFPLSASLKLTDARLVNRDDAEVTIAGDIAMLGDLSDALIEGKLNVQRAEIQIPDGGGSDLPELEVDKEIGGAIVNVEKTEETEAASPFDPKLDMTIAMPNQIYVRGRGLESEWFGDLAIKGPASAPSITGNLEVKTGYFDFLDKRFILDEGVIDFNGSSPPNPILALEASVTEDDFKAIIRLDGPADNPKISLSSEPVLPEDEVLARLLFNRELSQIGAIEAGKLAIALNRLRGGGGFDAFGEIRNALKIDTLDVVGGEEASDSKVKAGKYLNDDVYVEVEQGTAGDSSRARVEIELLPSLSLEADTGDDSTGGVGLKWRFNY